jgi:hypothetical protein
MSTAPYVLGAISAVALLKTFWRPHRVVVYEGGVSRCPGPNQYHVCDPTLAIDTPKDTDVYSTVSGQIIAVGHDFVHVASEHEPVVLYYDGIVPNIVEGQYVGRGQCIGTSSGRVYFGVTSFDRPGKAYHVDPASWLASRGQRVAAKDTGPGTSWCEAGRHISVPASAGTICDLRAPDRASFALLPVTVDIQR